MMAKILTKYPKIQKFLASLIIFVMLVPALIVTAPPKQVEAQWITFSPTEFAAFMKDLAGQFFKQVAMGIARKMLNAMTTRAVNWINSGFHGNPFYLSNTDAFFKDITKYEVKKFVNIYGYDKLKFPFGKQFALDTISSYQRQAQTNTEYSLSRVIKDANYLESYRNNFNVGGWNGFLINTQYPQNNYIGFTIKANEDLARKLDGLATTPAKKVQDTLEKSQGFLSPQLCKTNPKYNNGKNEFLQPEFNYSDYYKKNPYNCTTGDDEIQVTDNTCDAKYMADMEKAYGIWEKDNTCPGGLTTTTPGGVVANQLMTATSSKFRQSELGQAVGNSLSVIFDTLVSKLVDKSVGLLGMGSNNPPEDSKASEFDYKGGLKNGSAGEPLEICTDIEIAGGGGGKNTDGTPIDIGLEGGGKSCTTIPAGTVPAGPDPLTFFTVPGGPTPTNPPTGGPCVGGNTKCTCAEGVASYDVYADAVSVAESIAYPNGLPPGTTGTQAQTAVCAAYKGPGLCRAGKQEDEVIIEGLPSPYVTLSIDFLVGGAPYASDALYSRAVAACEAGQQ